MRTTPPAHIRLSLLPGLEHATPAQLRRIDEVVDECSRRAGQVLLREGAPSRQVLLIAEGLVEERSGMTPVALHAPGALVGLWSASHGVRSPTSAVAASDVHLYVVDASHLEAFLAIPPVTQLASAVSSEIGRAVERAARDTTSARNSRRVTGELGVTR